jgi:multidrug efflux pump subunit AcrA (membrane-fusion protein)
MKILKATLVSLIVSGIVFASYGCASSAGATPTAQPQITQVQRGNISISVIGTGNLAFSKSEKLAFDMAGTVEEVLVSEGDTVEAGAELVRLDIDNWEDQLKSLNRALTSAQRALVNKENNLNAALRQVSVKEMAVTQAEINLQTAEYNLGQIKEVKRAQDSVDAAQLTLDTAITSRKLNRESIDTEFIKELQAELEEAKANLQKVLARTDTRLSTTAALEIAQKVLAVDQNKVSLEEARAAAETARTDAEYARLDVEDARQDLKDAQEKLAEAQSLSPVIKAPFAGYITKVNVSGGDEVLKAL